MCIQCVWFKKAMPLCLCLLFLWGSSVQAAAMEPAVSDVSISEDEQLTASEKKTYKITLENRTIGKGESLAYTTISSHFPESSIEQGFYPGELTVEITGQVVVEEGGSLDIGTLSLGGPEARPVLTGTGTIVVKNGGSLRLLCADIVPNGEGPLIVQEPGGSVELDDTTAEEGSVQWSAPIVNNLYDSLDDVWIESGTKLTSDMLPASMQTTLQQEGLQSEVELSLSWDLSTYDGHTDGEIILTGYFLDETGQKLPSRVPLTITVRWYKPQTLIVSSAEWKGSEVPTVQLMVQELPEGADIWGEVSTDDGETWRRWEDEDSFFIIQSESDGWVCVFSVSEGMEGLFRVVAEAPMDDEYTFWKSDTFFMSAPEDSEDSEGNRGGSTTPDAPEREPEPAPLPEETSPSSGGDSPQQNENTSGQNAQQTSDTAIQENQQVHLKHQLYPGAEETKLTQKTAETDSVLAEEEQISQGQSNTEEEALSAEQTVSSQPAEELPGKETVSQLSTTGQILLGTAGAAVCIAAAAAGMRMYRKKK